MSFALRNGVVLPAVGLGTYKANGESLSKAVQWALDCGIQHIDTALGYRNYEAISKGIKMNGKEMDEVFVTSKIGPMYHGRNKAHEACETVLRQLNVDALDLMLIHWPGANRHTAGRFDIPQMRRETWEVLEELYKDKIFRAIGVSNYEISHLEELMSFATIPPMVNQIEVHPRFPNREVRQYCKEQGKTVSFDGIQKRSIGIQVVAYSSFGTGDLIGHPIVQEIAQNVSKSPSQVLLKWALQQDLAVIPKSIQKHRIEEWTTEHMQDWVLSSENMQRLDSMEDGTKYCWNPVNIH